MTKRIETTEQAEVFIRFALELENEALDLVWDAMLLGVLRDHLEKKLKGHAYWKSDKGSAEGLVKFVASEIADTTRDGMKRGGWNAVREYVGDVFDRLEDLPPGEAARARDVIDDM